MYRFDCYPVVFSDPDLRKMTRYETGGRMECDIYTNGE